VLRQRPIFLFIPPAWQRCRRHSPLPFRRFCLFFFFQEKEKQKEKQKRKMRPSFSPLFSFLFFFKKGKKRQSKRQVWRSRTYFFRHFCFVFCKKNGKRRAKRRELSFGSSFYFLEEKDEGERPAVLRADSPLLCDVKDYERIKLKR